MALDALLNRPRIEALMERHGIDTLVCVQPKHVYYISSYQSDWIFDRPWAAAAILPRSTGAPAALVVHDVELTAIAERPSWMPELRTYAARVCDEIVPHFSVRDGAELDALERRTLALLDATLPTARASLLDAVQGYLGSAVGARLRVGCDDPEFAAALAAAAPRVTTVDARQVLSAARAVKTPAELALLREAARRNEAALRTTFDFARPGRTWAEVHRTYMTAVAAQDCRPFCLYVGAGRRSMGLHADHDYRLDAGDQLCFDAMLTYERYFGDAQRTCVLGNPSAALRRAWAAVSAAAERCYEAIRPGADTGELRSMALATARQAGLRHFRHAFVHGLGLDHIEHPTEIRDFAPFVLEEGMVVNLDLEYCELGFGGIYFEDTVIVRAGGPERLYSLPRDLITLH